MSETTKATRFDMLASGEVLMRDPRFVVQEYRPAPGLTLFRIVDDGTGKTIESGYSDREIAQADADVENKGAEAQAADTRRHPGLREGARRYYDAVLVLPLSVDRCESACFQVLGVARDWSDRGVETVQISHGYGSKRTALAQARELAGIHGCPVMVEDK